ncbi:MAG: YIP1 family protein [Gemmatimonadota bacterium]
MAGTSGSMVERMTGAALLNIETYEEVEHDDNATGQAAAVVAMVAAAQAIGAAGHGLFGAVGAAAAALLGWLLWAGITYLVGTKLFDGTATWGELLRTLGFAQAPGILAVVGVLPLLGAVNYLIPLWLLVTGFIAVRQALDFGNGKTFLTILVGWAAYSVLSVVF